MGQIYWGSASQSHLRYGKAEIWRCLTLFGFAVFPVCLSACLLVEAATRVSACEFTCIYIH
jgi:hypothetical protein